MAKNSSRTAGRHFLQIPGPTPVPDRILRAMDMPTIDHRGPEFQRLGKRVLDGLKTIFKCAGPVVIYPASGTGAWEAALSNALSPGDHVLMVETGHFATLWKNMALKLGLAPEFIASDWRTGVDVTVGGSQKGLMLPPGLSFNAVGEKALAAAKNAKLPKSFWSWEEMIANNRNGFFPYTPATNLLYALAESIDMLHEEGLENVFARHDRHAEATRRAVRGWGLEIWCREPKDYSSSLTTVLMPEGQDADRFRKAALEHFDISLGTGLSKLGGKVFRIGHLGDTNGLTIVGALAGVEMGLALAGVAHRKGGVQAAMDYLEAAASPARAAAE